MLEKTLARRLLPAALAAAAPMAAHAAAVSYATDFGLSWTPDVEVVKTFGIGEGFIALYELPRFDASLGTLTGVSLGFTSRATSRLVATSVSNNIYIDANTAYVDAALDMRLQFSLFDPAGASSYLRTLRAEAGCFDQQDAGTVTCTATDDASMGLNAGIGLGAVNLADFVGADPINLFARMDAEVSGSCSADVGAYCWFQYGLGTLAAWAGTATVTYTYLAAGDGGTGGGTGGGGNGTGGGTVPEPGTLALAGAALAGLLVRRRPLAPVRV